jgi:phosphoenolpyruvate carboxylase
MKQNPDIKFLGRVLGDVIRSYGGEALFKRGSPSPPRWRRD